MPEKAVLPERTGVFTHRQLQVVEAIKKGKPNKIIAYELNMCESTVKVHVRTIMKKLHARNRTQVAYLYSASAGLEQPVSGAA
jgi:DNA-binding NarL/FixJ family response regulator